MTWALISVYVHDNYCSGRMEINQWARFYQLCRYRDGSKEKKKKLARVNILILKESKKFLETNCRFRQGRSQRGPRGGGGLQDFRIFEFFERAVMGTLVKRKKKVRPHAENTLAPPLRKWAGYVPDFR